jgi:hypothetical protein
VKGPRLELAAASRRVDGFFTVDGASVPWQISSSLASTEGL